MHGQYSLRGKRVWVAGHRGLVGSAVVRQLANKDCSVLTVSRDDVDLRCQQQVDNWMRENRPEAVFLCAAKVGGIVANANEPADFLTDNLLIEANIIKAAFEN